MSHTDPAELTLDQLDAALARIEAAWRARPGREPAAALVKFRRALSAHHGQSLAAYLEARAQRAAPASEPRKLYRQVVSEYAAQLEQAGRVKSSFEHVLERLRNDRRVRKLELDAIADAYAGKAARRSKQAGFEDIEAAFFERALRAHNAKIAGDTTPW